MRISDAHDVFAFIHNECNALEPDTADTPREQILEAHQIISKNSGHADNSMQGFVRAVRETIAHCVIAPQHVIAFCKQHAHYILNKYGHTTSFIIGACVPNKYLVVRVSRFE